MTESVDELLARARAEYGDKIRGAIYSRVPAEDAADVEQECWISIYSALRTYRHEASLGSFVFPIVRRRIADYYR